MTDSSASTSTPPSTLDVEPITRSILIVDDEPSILLAFRRLLQSPTRVVETASTIEDAERLLSEKAFWCVVADLRLTGVLGREGLELIRFVREKQLDTRVILVTGYGGPEIMEEAQRLGADFYFEKPVSVQVLKDALATLERAAK